MRAFLVLAAVFAATAVAYPPFRGNIPNGFWVFKNGELWPGVGHLASAGGGPLNIFGQAFNASGRKWTRALCEADTDGDGFTNGMELGDPHCTWTVGATPSRQMYISHPAFKDSVPNIQPLKCPTQICNVNKTCPDPTIPYVCTAGQAIGGCKATPWTNEEGCQGYCDERLCASTVQPCTTPCPTSVCPTIGVSCTPQLYPYACIKGTDIGQCTANATYYSTWPGDIGCQECCDLTVCI